MLATLALVYVLLLPRFSVAGPFKCQTLFSQKAAQKSTQTRIPKKSDRKPFMMMNFAHDLHPKGRAALFELTVFESPKVAMHPITQKFVDSLRTQYPESQFTVKDKLLVLDVLGDKDGIFKSLALQTISQLSLDMVGVETYSINYRMLETSPGQRRILFVIKNGAKDYRDSISDAHRLITKDDFSQWIANELMTAFDKLIKPNIFSVDHRDPNFAKAHNILSGRRGVARDQARARMSESEFQIAFSRAYSSFMASLKGMEVLHVRPSFWDEKPLVDSEALDLFRTIYQGRNAEEFQQNFTAETLKLRERLYSFLHRYSSGRMNGYASSVDIESVSVRGLSRMEQDAVFVGSENQVDFGQDFFAGAKHQYAPISDLAITKSAMSPLVEKLERAGYTEMTQLSGANALVVLEKSNMSVSDLITVAREAAEHGVYLRYPPQIYFQLSLAERMELKPPSIRKFFYNPLTNNYVTDSWSPH